jgi:hypothetical protein
MLEKVRDRLARATTGNVLQLAVGTALSVAFLIANARVGATGWAIFFCLILAANVAGLAAVAYYRTRPTERKPTEPESEDR